MDGLRGLAALYVVIHHAYMEVVSEQMPVFLPFLTRHLTNWLFFGQVAVDIFIVLSGFSLMLPVARSGNELRGGVRQYLLRRARRILPPYYAALVLFVVVIALVPGMNQRQGFRWDAALPALTPGNLAAHLLLLQNLRPDWLHAIDPPMWSVATEWQIYFLFPFLLLPIWRRFGNLAMVSVAFAAGLIPHFVLHSYNFACPWFSGLFALGAAAAVVSVQPSSASERFLSRASWVCLLLLTVFLRRRRSLPLGFGTGSM